MNFSDFTRSFSEWFRVEASSSNTHLNLYQLEERVLYSAVPLPVDLVEPTEEAGDPNDANLEENIAENLKSISDSIDTIEELENYGIGTDDRYEISDLPVVGEYDSLGDSRSTNEVVFVDASVDDFQVLVDDILAQSNGSRNFEIVFVNQNADGIGQITEFLSETSEEFSAIHLVTHGSDAQLQIGNTSLGLDNVGEYQEEFEAWQRALTDGADLLIYGCNVAESDAGESFVDLLSETIGVDIAASDDITGAESLGGDWEFEYFAGTVEGDVAFSIDVYGRWDSTLAVENVSEGGGPASRSIGVSDDGVVVTVGTETGGSDLDVVVTRTNQFGDVLTATTVVHDDTAGNQTWATVAVAADGAFVVVWTSDHLGEEGVFARLFDSSGNSVGSEFRVDPVGSQGNDASVAMDAAGNFVVAWEGSGDDNPGTTGDDTTGIYAQRFDNLGTRLGLTFQVNAIELGVQQDVDVSMNDAGEFVIAYDDFQDTDTANTVYATKYDDSGVATTQENVFSNTSFYYTNASVDINNAGDIIVTADREATDSAKGGLVWGTTYTNNAADVVGKFYQSDGTPGSEFIVNSTLAGDQHYSSVVLLDDNTIQVAWEGSATINSAADAAGVYIRSFDSSDPDATASDEAFIDPTEIFGTQSRVNLVTFNSGDDFATTFQDSSGNYEPTFSSNVNARPTGMDGNVTTDNYGPYTFVNSDFDSTDPEGTSTQKIKIETLPTGGLLWLAGTVVSSGDEIDISDINSGELVYLPPVGVLDDVSHTFTYKVSDGVNYSDAVATLTVDIQFEESLLYTHVAAQSGDATYSDWEESELVRFGGPTFSLEDGSKTEGDVFSFFNLEAFSAVNMDAAHYVARTVDVGGMNLLAGDVLFSITNDGVDLNGTIVDSEDIVLFRADDSSYTSGTFTVVVDMSDIGGHNTAGFSLVENDTTIDGETITAGDFLFVGADPLGPTVAGENANATIHKLSLTQAGINSIGSTSVFVLGMDVGISEDIVGIEFVERTITIGGVTLDSGSLVLSIGADDSVGDNNLGGIREEDLFSLALTSTSVGGTAAGDAAKLYDGSDATPSNLGNARPDGFTLVTRNVSNQSPFIDENAGLVVDEGDPATTITNSMLNALDPDDNPSGIEYVLDSIVTEGTLRLDGTVLAQNDTFTQADINAGLLTYEHDGSEPAGESFNFTVSDGGEDGSTSDSGTFTITINQSNDAPSVLTNLGLNLDEGDTQTITSAMLHHGDPDDDDTDIIYTIDSIVGNGILRVNGTVMGNTSTFTQRDIDFGVVTYEHDGTDDLNDSFQFTIRDNDNAASTQATFLITANNVNDAPSVQDNTGLTINEGATKTITSAMLHHGDPDDDGADIIYTVDTTVARGTLTLNGSAVLNGGTFTQADIDANLVAYQHNGTENFNDQFTFTVRDDDNLAAPQAIFGIFVSAGNDAPTVGSNTGLNLDEGATETITDSMLHHADPDNDGIDITYTVDTTVTNGTLMLNGSALGDNDTFTQSDIDSGLITYAHDGTENFSDSFLFTIRDSSNEASSQATFSISVDPLNDSPEIGVNNGLTLDEDATETITALMLHHGDPDDDGADITYTVDSTVSNGTLRVNGSDLADGGTFTQADIDAGLVIYEHDGSENLSDSFLFTIRDDDNLASPQATFSISVDAMNDAPTVLVNTGLIVQEGGNMTIIAGMLHHGDPDDDGAEITYTLDTTVANGKLYLGADELFDGDTFTQADIDSGSLRYEHDGSETSNDSFLFTIRDDDNLASSQATFSISVLAQNDIPGVGTNLGLNLDEGATETISAALLHHNDGDDDGVDIVFTVDTTVVNGILRVNGTALTDGGTFTQADIDAGLITYEHDNTENLTDSFRFTIRDDENQASPQLTFTISVNAVNDSPTVLVNTGLGTSEGATRTITDAMLHHGDPDDDGANIIYTVDATVGNGKLYLNGVELLDADTFTQSDIDSGLVSYEHDGSETTTDAFTFTIRDDDNAAASQASFDISISALNDSPSVGTNLGLNLDEGATETITAGMLHHGDPDDDGSDITYTVDTSVVNGTLRLNGVVLNDNDTFTQADLDSGLVTYEHDGTENLSDSFLFTIRDDEGAASPQASFSISVDPLNDSPTVQVNTGLGLSEGATRTITDTMLHHGDPDDDGAEIIYTVDTTVINGQIELSGSALSDGETFTQADIDAGRVSYVHDGTETTTDSFIFTVRDDDNAAAAQATFNINILATNDPVSDLTNGMAINSSGDNVALSTDNFLDGLSQFTFETLFAAEFDTSTPLVSVATATESNDFFVELIGDGTLGVWVSGENVILSGMNYDQLMDGTLHALAVSFDGSTGSYEVHVDGSLVDSGVGLAVGKTVAAGGNIEFGQEQDSIGGDYNVAQVFSGRFYDIRIWDDVRTSAEIDAHYNQQFDASQVPSGLVANWQFSESDSGNTVENTVSPGTSDLVLKRVTGTGFTNGDVIRNLVVSEDATNGTTIGYVIPTDLEPNTNLVFTLLENPGNRFAINSTTGEITVADSSQLNFESDAQHTIRVQVEDDGGSLYDEAYDIEVINVNEAPTDLFAGIQLNNDGGDNQYFAVNNGNPTSMFSGLDEVTFEVVFAFDGPLTHQATLLSYNDGGRDEITLSINIDGTLTFEIENDVFTTTETFPDLFDGKKHHLAIGWDMVGGVVQLHIDGSPNSTVYGNINPGESLSGNGVLVFGQEQDAENGSFNTDQTFHGTIYDIRIWDETRSTTEIAFNLTSSFSSENIPEHLIANWQMTELTGAGLDQVVDLVNPGSNDLGLLKTTESGFSDSNAIVGLTVGENEVDGTSAGFIHGNNIETIENIVVDGDFNAVHVTDSNFTAFYANGNGAGNQIGEWTVVNRAVDIRGSEWQPSPQGGHALDLGGGFGGDDGEGTIEQVLETEAGREYIVLFAMSGNFEGSLSQQRLNVNIDGDSTEFSYDEPSGWSRTNLQWESRSMTFVASSDSTVLQFEALTGGARGAMIGDVHVIEVTSIDSREISYALTDDAGGRFTIDASTGEVTVVDQSLLDFETATSHDIVVEITDDGGPTYSKTVTIQIQDENESPSIATNNPLVVDEGGTATITTSLLNEGDVDDDGNEITYEVVTEVSNGTLRLGTSVLNVGDEFTQEDIDTGRLTYEHDDTETNSDSFDFRISDGGEDGATTVESTFNITVNLLNEAPTGTTNNITVPENTPYTLTINDFGYFDPESTPMAGVRIDTVTSVGTLELSGVAVLDGQFITAADIVAGRLIYTDNFVSDSLTFSVSDGALFSSANTLNFGTVFVPDPPTSADNTVVVDEDDTYTFELSDFAFNDPDPGDSLDHIEIKSLSRTGVLKINGTDAVVGDQISALQLTNGELTFEGEPDQFGNDYLVFEFVVNDGTLDSVANNQMTVDVTGVQDDPVALGGTFSTNEDVQLTGSLASLVTDVDPADMLTFSTSVDVTNGSLNINSDGSFTYTPSINFFGNDSFVYQVSDGNGGVETASVTITISAINDAPDLEALTGLSLVGQIEGTTNPAGLTVGELLERNGSSVVKDTETLNVGIAVFGANDSLGTWEFSLDNGATWVSFGSLGISATDETNGLLLDSTSKVRFVPDDGVAGVSGTIDFRAWDQSSGATGDTGVDTTYTGLTSAFSSASSTVSTSVVDSVETGVAGPAADGTVVNGSLTFSTALGNAIVIDDGSADNSQLEVVITVGNGTFLLPATGGVLTSQSYDALTETGTLILQGLEADINSALDGLIYVPNTEFVGNVIMNVEVQNDTGILGEFEFDASDGSDTSGNDNHADIRNGSFVSDAERGNVLLINNGGDVEIQSSGAATNLGSPANVTLAGWVFADPGTADSDLISIGGGISIRLDYSGNANGSFVSGVFQDAASGTTLSTDSNISVGGSGWHHIAFTFDDANNVQVLYINGVEVARTTFTESIDYAAVGTFVGKNPTSGANNLNGMVDDISVFASALSADQINALFTSSTEASHSIAIEVIDDRVRAGDDFFSGIEDSVITGNVLTNDIDGDMGTLIVNPTPVTGPTFGNLVLNTDGSFTYTPNEHAFGTDTFEYSVSSSVDGETTTALVTITITPENDTPTVIVPSVINVNENQVTVIDFDISDPDGPNGTYSLGGADADKFSISTSGEVVFVAAPDFENPNDRNNDGTYDLTLQVSDGIAQSPVHHFQIIVDDVSDYPTAVDDAFTLNEGNIHTSLTGWLFSNDLDPLAEGLTVSLVNDVEHGMLQLNSDGSIEYVHDGSETIADSFTYRIVGSDGQRDEATVTIEINPVQDPTQTADDGIYVLDSDQTILIEQATLLANDFDPDSTEFEILIVEQPERGLAFVDGSGALVFSPDIAEEGLFTLKYVVVADGVTSDPASVTFNVGLPNRNVATSTESGGESPGTTTVFFDPTTKVNVGQEETEDEGSEGPLVSTIITDNTADVFESDSSEIKFGEETLVFDLNGETETYVYAGEGNVLSFDIIQSAIRSTSRAGAGAVSTFDATVLGAYWDELDSAKQDFLMKFDLAAPKIVASVTSFLTVGYLAWVVRGGVLLTTFMSSLPAWQSFDPLPVIESSGRTDAEDDESIAEMVN